MSMDNYHPDLIFDLAAGNLPEAEAHVAEASLSAESRTELHAQWAVLAAIADAPPVTMTDIERARLYRSVASAISETTRELSPLAVAATTPPTRPGKNRVWMRGASAAAVAAMFVGVVAVGLQLGRIGPSSDAARGTETTALAAADTSTTALAAGGDDLPILASGPPRFTDGSAGGDGDPAERRDLGNITDQNSDVTDRGPGMCRLHDSRDTEVPCSEAHEWETVGPFTFENLASFTPYPGAGLNSGIWAALYLQDCTAVATAAASNAFDLPAGTAIVGTAVIVPTFDEWASGDGTVICGAGVEVVQDVDRSRPVPKPLSGSGSLIYGTWSRTP